MAMTAESLRAPLLFVIDIGNGLIQQPIRPQLMKGDKKANTIIVRVMDGNEPVDLTGATVTGSFISPVEGAEIPLTGSVSGNEASVTLADACYAEDGCFEANVKLTVGETARTILSITGNVLSKGSGAMIDIDGVIPSIDDIIAQYAAMKQAVEDANAARDAANTAAENASTAAQNANNAAAKIDGMTVSAVSGTSAAASISEQNGAKHISFTLPKGDKGDKGDQGEPGQNGTGSGTVTGVKIGDETYAPDDAGMVDMSGMTAPDATLLNGKSADEYLQKSQVVNNFTTTEEGFVADARALKILYDGVEKKFTRVSVESQVISSSGFLAISGFDRINHQLLPGIDNSGQGYSLIPINNIGYRVVELSEEGISVIINKTIAYEYCYI